MMRSAPGSRPIDGGPGDGLCATGPIRLAEEVAAEEHAVADLFFVEMTGEAGAREGAAGADEEHEAEPGGGASRAGFALPLEAAGSPGPGVGGEVEFEEFLEVGEAAAEGSQFERRAWLKRSSFFSCWRPMAAWMSRA